MRSLEEIVRDNAPPKMLKLAAELEVPLEAVTQKWAFLARSGAGKTYAAGKLVEEMIQARAQVVIVDPVGVWWGLRTAADGKGAGIAIPVFGGHHGDVPLEAAAGELVADLVATRRLSVVLDVSSFTKREMRRFVTDFADALFDKKKVARSPVMVVWEECQTFVPQKVGPDAAPMVGAMEDLIKKGRNYGVGTTLISQRPQAVNKDVLNQTEVLVVLQTTGAHERKAIREWIVEQDLDDAVLDTLPSLGTGEAYVWSPGWLRLFRKVKISRKRTYDASATPTFGQEYFERPVAPVNLDEVRKAMAGAIERAEQEDPTALRRRVAELERALKQRPAAEPKIVEVSALKEADLQRLEVAAGRVIGEMNAFAKIAGELSGTIAAATKRTHLPPAPVRVEAPRVPPRAPAPSPTGAGARLDRGAREMLAVLATRAPQPVTRHQLATLAGYNAKGGTFRTYLSVLRREALIVEQGDFVTLTSAGHQAAPDVTRAVTTEDLVELWGAKFDRGARRMLEVLVEQTQAGHTLTRDELGQLTGYDVAGGTFRTYLSALRRNGLLEERPNGVQASRTLFP